MSSRARRCGAFSLMEILVALAIVAVLAAVIIPGLNAYLETARIRRIEETLVTLARGVRDYKSSTGSYPSDLLRLTTQPVVGDNDVCGAPISAAQVAAWHGPYLSITIGSAGVVVGEDTVITTLKRKPVTAAFGGELGVLQLIVENASSATALRVDADLDGDASLISGVVTWNTASGPPRLFYAVQIAGC